MAKKKSKEPKGIVVTFPCGDRQHRLLLCAGGRVVFLDHDIQELRDELTMRAIAEELEVCRCTDLFKYWRTTKTLTNSTPPRTLGGLRELAYIYKNQRRLWQKWKRKHQYLNRRAERFPLLPDKKSMSEFLLSEFSRVGLVCYCGNRELVPNDLLIIEESEGRHIILIESIVQKGGWWKNGPTSIGLRVDTDRLLLQARQIDSLTCPRKITPSTWPAMLDLIGSHVFSHGRVYREDLLRNESIKEKDSEACFGVNDKLEVSVTTELFWGDQPKKIEVTVEKEAQPFLGSLLERLKDWRTKSLKLVELRKKNRGEDSGKVG